MSDKLCPECGHIVEAHTDMACNEIVEVDGKPSYCECMVSSATLEAIFERDEARKLAARYFLAGDAATEYSQMIDDGMGQFVFKWCEKCGGEMQVVRPGKFQCTRCGK